MKNEWGVIWMSVADVVGSRSGCTRAQVGAAIVSSTNRIVATGYNGPPAGMDKTCVSCPRTHGPVGDPLSYDDCITIHAEANALLFCDRRDREGGTIYVSSTICVGCAKLVANSGLARVEFRDDAEHRSSSTSVQLLRDSGLQVVRWPD